MPVYIYICIQILDKETYATDYFYLLIEKIKV